MLVVSAALLLAAPSRAVFPEQVPGLMEECLAEAVAAGDVSDTDDSHKYICAGDAARRIWAFLESARVSSYEQETPEGRWLSRDFPLGGCFKRVRLSDGSVASTGLSCTIWVPRPVVSTAVSEP